MKRCLTVAGAAAAALLIAACDESADSGISVCNGVTAHRGDSSEYPENTIPAFQSAIGLGADWIELDVHETRDGHLVVIHDPTTGRTGNRDLTVATSTLAELQTVDVAHAFRVGNGLSILQCPVERIPTLSNVLARVAAQSITSVSIHPKTFDIVDKAMDLVLSMDVLPLVGFNEGDAPTLLRVKQRNASVPVFWSVGPTADVESCIKTASRNGFESVLIHVDGITAEKVSLLHDAGLEVGAWTVNSTAVMSNLLCMGVERLYTDCPRQLIAIKNRDDDHDSLPDIWQQRFFGSAAGPLCDPWEDPDHDGMVNRAEYLAGTDPTDPNS